MTNRSWTPAVTRFLVCIVMASAACASSPKVKPSCAISWDQSADYWRVTEYHLTVWKMNGDRTSLKTTHVVNASYDPGVLPGCRRNTSGRWLATVQACLSDGTCSQAGKSTSFQVAE